MSEAEDLLIEAGLRTALAARELWLRYVPRSGPLPLSAVRWRIELFLTAVYGPCPMIVPSDPPLERTLLQALLHNRAPQHRPRVALPSTDGYRIHLPRNIEPSRGDAADLALFRLFALEMAARARRGTHAWLPDASVCRDLFLVAEAVAVDAQLLRDVPGLAGELTAERAHALATRPRVRDLPAREAGVEAWVQRALSSTPAELARNAPPTAADSLAWAEAQARTLASLPGRYRGLAPVLLWGRVERAAQPLGAGSPSPPSAALAHGPRRVTQLPRTPRARVQTEDSDPQPGAFVVKPNAAQQSVEDPHGLSRPADRELTPDIADIAAALAELPEAQLVRTPAPTREVLCADALPLRAAAAASSAPRAALSYPEWDHARGTYRTPGAHVHEPAAPLGDVDVARAALARHAALVRDVRRRFERLRLRPRRSTRQLDGDELDLTAYVAGFADRRAGVASDDRIYEASRRVRRELSTCVLLDASASTDSTVDGRQRVIDIEKDALLVVNEALAHLGNPYALLAFSGESSARVDVLRLKSFDEPAGELVQRRIAGLEPDRYTRLGAALRHATALLARRPARHRLLLLLSDGKPNDVDQYDGPYGVEDARRATIEARLAGVHIFCLAVDRQAPRYAPRIFGGNGFALLARADRLPQAVVGVLRQLVIA